MVSKAPTSQKIEKLFLGKIIHSLEFGDLEIFQGAVAVSPNGIISYVIKDLNSFHSISELFDIEKEQIFDLGSRFLIPGFVDTHCHAPQYLYTGILDCSFFFSSFLNFEQFFSHKLYFFGAGTGTGIDLLQWLEKFTFNYESKYSDLEFAHNVYRKGSLDPVSVFFLSGCFFFMMKFLQLYVVHFGMELRHVVILRQFISNQQNFWHVFVPNLDKGI